MGVKEALEFFETPKRRRQALENVRGKTFAVEASSRLRKVVASTSLGSSPARLLRQPPPGDVEEFAHSWLRRAVERLDRYEVNAAFVFDGARLQLGLELTSRRRLALASPRPQRL